MIDDKPFNDLKESFTKLMETFPDEYVTMSLKRHTTRPGKEPAPIDYDFYVAALGHFDVKSGGLLSAVDDVCSKGLNQYELEAKQAKRRELGRTIVDAKEDIDQLDTEIEWLANNK